MASLLDMRRRIKSVKNTQQITKAMKMVAAAKLKRATDRVTAARPFAQKMSQVLETQPCAFKIYFQNIFKNVPPVLSAFERV